MNGLRKTIPYIILTAIIGAGVAVQSGVGQNKSIPTETPSQASPTITPTATYAGCAYTWATHDLPDTTKALDVAVKRIQVDATAFAQAFGEDCTYQDGTSTFGIIETDFSIIFQADLTSAEEMGGLLVQGMEEIQNLPKELTPGGRTGKATFTFKQGGQQKNVEVDINAYNQLDPDLTNQEIFNTFNR
jgi:hypothetical protein